MDASLSLIPKIRGEAAVLPTLRSWRFRDAEPAMGGATRPVNCFRWLLLASALLAFGGRSAHATTVTYSGTDPTDKLDISLSFSYSGALPVTSFLSLDAFSLIITAQPSSSDPSASWSLSDISTIHSESTNTYNEAFNWTGSLDGNTQMESMGNDGAFNSYGFNLQGLSTSSFTVAYGVGTSTEYTGNWTGVALSQAPLSTPEPSSLALLGFGMLAVGFAARRHPA